jgi:hypothetical protein
MARSSDGPASAQGIVENFGRAFGRWSGSARRSPLRRSTLEPIAAGDLVGRAVVEMPLGGPAGRFDVGSASLEKGLDPVLPMGTLELPCLPRG